MKTMTIYTSTLCGDASNKHYPHKHEVTDAATLKVAVGFDHVAAEYVHDLRSTDNFASADCLVMDIDNDHTDHPNEWVTPDGLADVFSVVPFMCATSRNHMKPKGGRSARPRFHVYFPIERTDDPQLYSGLKKLLASRYSFFDPNAVDAARFIYGNPAAEVFTHPGDMFVDEYLTGSAFLAFDKDHPSEQIGEGSRNTTLSRFAGRVLIRFGETQRARELFERKAATCEPPLPAWEVEAIWRSALRFAHKVAETPGYIAPEVYGELSSLIPETFSDLGQASVLASRFGEQLCFSPATRWMAYKRGVWQELEPLAHGCVQDLTYMQLGQAQEMLEKAKEAMRKTGAEQIVASMSKAKAAAVMTKEQHRAYHALCEAQSWLKFVVKCQSSNAIKAAMREAEPLLLIDPAVLDHDPYLLNTPDGSCDLRVGLASRREHDPSDMCTRQTSVTPNLDGMEIWEEALATIFQKDAELIGYVQRICGLALIGKVMIEALIIAYGDGSNGKSTFWNTIARCFGSYADAISADVLIAGKKNSAKNDMAETRGKRLLIAAETEEGKRLSTASAKQLASTDKIAAEKKYKDPFSFTPTHTLVLYTNHLPKVGASDTGIWRRLIVIPFNATITGTRDIKNYSDHLFEHAGGAVLAWVMEGARLIHEEGYRLKVPACVLEATEAYRQANDWFAHFLEDKCRVGDALTCPSGELYREYRAWAISCGEYVRSTRDFYEALARAGFTRRKTNRHTIVCGLELVSEF